MKPESYKQISNSTFTSPAIGHRPENIIRIASSDSNHTTYNYSHPRIFPAFGFLAENRYIYTVMQGDRRRRRRNGQAGARPCKTAVGNAGHESEKPPQSVDIHQAFLCANAPLSAL